MSEIATDLLVAVEDAVAAEIKTLALFANHADCVLTERNDAVELTLDKALAKSNGLYLLVSIDGAEVPNPDEPGPVLDGVEVSVEIVEKVSLNHAAGGTRIAAKTAIRAVLTRIHHFQPRGLNVLLYSGPKPFQPLDSIYNAWRVNFRCTIALTPNSDNRS